MRESRQGLRSIGRLNPIRLVLGFSPGSASDQIARWRPVVARFRAVTV
jgi:hypothetical protein